MKKLILCLAASALFVGTAAAQDIIIKHNGEEVQSKVVEIGDTQIKYRKFANPTGPIYSIASSEVFVVKFENGAKEVITAAESAPQEVSSTESTTQNLGTTTPTDNSKYAQVATAQKIAKKPLHDKKFYMGVKAQGGFAFMSAGGLGGAMVGATVFGEWYPSLYKSVGLGLGIGYERYMLSDDNYKFNLGHLNVDLAATTRSKKHVYGKAGIRIGLPISAEIEEVDVLEVCKTTFGLFADVGWSSKHFDVGGGLAYAFSNILDSGDANSKIFSISIHAAYRF
ncbi:MAG: hypothetical protein RRY23_07860 [Alistipes sp.]